MGRSPSCCSGMDYVEIDTESRSRKARTLDMNGYSNRLELEYDELISRYSPDDGSLIIEIKIESSNKKWLKHYKAPCFEEDFEEIQIKLSEASDNDSINVYLYENNPSLHAAVGHSEILDSYPLLIDVNKEFQLLLSQKGDLTKYVVINSINHNLVLI